MPPAPIAQSARRMPDATTVPVQFWYTQQTAELVAQEVVDAAAGRPIACVACPSLFRKLRQDHPDVTCQLLEFDRRFEV